MQYAKVVLYTYCYLGDAVPNVDVLNDPWSFDRVRRLGNARRCDGTDRTVETTQHRRSLRTFLGGRLAAASTYSGATSRIQALSNSFASLTLGLSSRVYIILSPSTVVLLFLLYSLLCPDCMVPTFACIHLIFNRFHPSHF